MVSNRWPNATAELDDLLCGHWAWPEVVGPPYCTWQQGQLGSIIPVLLFFPSLGEWGNNVTAAEPSHPPPLVVEASWKRPVKDLQVATSSITVSSDSRRHPGFMCLLVVMEANCTEPIYSKHAGMSNVWLLHNEPLLPRVGYSSALFLWPPFSSQPGKLFNSTANTGTNIKNFKATIKWNSSIKSTCQICRMAE